MGTAFVDLYETLQLSPNASAETVERVYRLLAKRYHPDNQETGDAQKFSEVHSAYETLMDPTRRAAYDVNHEQQRGQTWKIFDQRCATDEREGDRRLFQGVLSLLYAARRRDPRGGGLGSVALEKMLGAPREHLDFPIWYLKARGWIETLDTGQFAITVEGIDKLTSVEGAMPTMPMDRLLPESSLEEHTETRRSRKRLLQNVS